MLKPIRFRRHWRGYNSGEVAGFPPAECAYLIKGGFAEDLEEEAPQASPEPEPEPRRRRRPRIADPEYNGEGDAPGE